MWLCGYSSCAELNLDDESIIPFTIGYHNSQEITKNWKYLKVSFVCNAVFVGTPVVQNLNNLEHKYVTTILIT